MSSFYASVPPEQRQALESFRDSDRQRSMRIDGREWRYVATGEGGRTLVILPGGFSRADMWLRPILSLEKDYRIIAVDASLEVFASGPFCDAVFEILGREGVDTFTALGSSYGGGLVQHLLHHHTERLEHAVLSHCTPVSSRVLRLMRILRVVVRLIPGRLLKALSRRRRYRFHESSDWQEYTQAYYSELKSPVDKATMLDFLPLRPNLWVDLSGGAA